MTDILDDYAQSPRPRGTLTAEYVYWNSGHRLLCPKCKKFQRTSADWTDGPVLRVICKVCKTYVDFVVTDEGLTPKWFDGHIRSFTMARVRGLLKSHRPERKV